MDYALLSILAAIWGGSFMLIKVAGHDWPPATMTAARLMIASAILFAVAAYYGEKIRPDYRIAGTIILVGLFGNSLPFTLIAWGEETVDASVAAVLMGIMPIATLVMAHFLSDDEVLTARKLAGVGIGLVGLVVLAGPAVLLRLGEDGISQLAILAAAISYALNAILTKKLLGLPRRAAAAWLLLAGAFLMLPVVAVYDKPYTVDLNFASAGAVVLLGIFPTALAALLMFDVLDRQGAGFFGQVNLLVPLFGIIWAVAFLGERPDLSAYLALVFIVAGIWISRAKQSGLARMRNRL